MTTLGGDVLLLSVNAGSSSLKVAVFEVSNTSRPVVTIALENVTSMSEAVEITKEGLAERLGARVDDITAIGHRVVHGGDRYRAATKVTPEVIDYLDAITSLAPNHIPNALVALRAFMQLYPDVSHVACFDTSFFHSIPEVAQVLPLPIELQRELSIRRYGFHGLSYEYVLGNFREHEGDVAARGRVIVAHLGSGASVAALKEGMPVDMSMGFTPVSGVMMSTRTGDIEPGVVAYIQKTKGMTNDEIADIVTYRSGLLGVSGITADMRTLLEAQHENHDAKLAVELFCSRVQKAIGGFMTVLGGVDSIIFTAAIGERSAEIRARICQALEFAGVVIDEGRNSNSERLISAEASRVGVHVIPTKEDQSIAFQTMKTIGKELS